MTKILRRIATALAMLGTLAAIPASAAEWNARMPYDARAVMGPAIPSIVVLDHIYKPAVPTPMTAMVSLRPTRPRG